MTGRGGSAADNRGTAAVDGYMASLPKARRDVLEQLRDVVKAAMPGVQERLAYGVIVFALKRDLVGLASQKRFCSFYTMSPRLTASMAADLRDYEVSGATIHFTPEKPLSIELVRAILDARLADVQ